MEDIYIIRDETSIAALGGHRFRKGGKTTGGSPQTWRPGKPSLQKAMPPRVRRRSTPLTSNDRFFEHFSCLVNGVALLAVGLFFVLTGLTFLPILGLIVGGYIIIEALVVMAAVVHKPA